jgi:hypothetical protein
MAGSWNHIVKDGKLLRNEDAVKMLENGGDWYEFAEEAYGMVWWLAETLGMETNQPPFTYVELARKGYLEGIKESPGTDGVLPKDEDELPRFGGSAYSMLEVTNISIANVGRVVNTLDLWGIHHTLTSEGLALYPRSKDESDYLHALLQGEEFKATVKVTVHGD